MKVAHGIIVLLALASSSARPKAAVACPAPPVVTSSGAICLAEVYVAAAAAAQPHPLRYQAEEHESFWFVVYTPEGSNVLGGGGKLRIEKTTGRVVFVEGYR